MKKYALIALCLLVTFGVVQVVANAHQVEPPEAPAANESVFLPWVARQQSIDLTITRLEISQAIQTPGQTVPLVANRPVVVRVYLQAIAPQAINGVNVSFAATRAGAPLAGSPLVVGPVTAPLAPAQGVYASTVNVTLSEAWRAGNVTLTVTADPSNAFGESDETNNQRATTLVFNNVPPLDLKIVPIQYHDTRTGTDYPAVSTDPVSELTRRMFPLSGINVSYRASYSFTGDLSNVNEWSRILNEVTDRKFADGAPASQVYYGLLPPSYSPPYVRGIGWLGLRAAVGVGFDTTVGAHEIGHTFGRLHAPCGGPANPDPNYPYANASIGNYGIDVYSNMLISPGAPSNTKDLMSYCSPQWVSDYTYVGLYNDQRSHGLAEVSPEARLGAHVATTQALLVRARLDDPQPAELLPVYSVEGFPQEAPASSEYTVELFDQQGELIAAHPVQRYETADLDPAAFAVYAALPQPAQAISKIRLVYLGAVLAERLMSDRVPPQALPQTPDISDNAITLTWEGAHVPALVRYATGPVEQWTTLGWVTLGMDILGGRLAIDRTRLPDGDLHFEVIPADASIPIQYTLDVPAGK
jgi:hypothetical protein